MKDGLVVMRDALGFALLAFGGLSLWIWWSGGGALEAGCPDAGYLPGVWCRTQQSPYQTALFAMAVSAVPHFLWTRHRIDPMSAAAYDRFALWGQTVMTSLGFLGTVIGVSIAVAGLGDALANDDPQTLVQGLSAAFDTTFLGLLGALQFVLLRQLLHEEWRV